MSFICILEEMLRWTCLRMALKEAGYRDLEFPCSQVLRLLLGSFL